RVAARNQASVRTSPTIVYYALDLCAATRAPAAFGIAIDGVDMSRLVLAGVRPRGMGMLMRAAKVAAWLEGRDMLLPADLHAVLHETIAHRVFFSPVYELQRPAIIDALMRQLVERVPSP
ncbi:MAG: MoxR family ATPase, partial [Gammaproteobacteria bacterium]